MLNRIVKDPGTLFFENHPVLDRAILVKNCPLSNKSEFWVELEAQHSLFNTEMYALVPDPSVLSQELAKQFQKLDPFTISSGNAETKTLLRYSNESITTLYKLENVKGIKDPKLVLELDQLVARECIKLDKLATILIIPEEMNYFSRFDGITLDDLKSYFKLNNQGAIWILNILQESGVLLQQTVKMMRLTINDSKWEKTIRAQLVKDAKKPLETEPIEIRLLYSKAGVLQLLKENNKLLNVNEEVIRIFCELNEEDAKKFFAYLTNENIIEPYLYNIWRMNSKIDCSALPACIASHIDEFLADRFAYAFALEEVCFFFIYFDF